MDYKNIQRVLKKAVIVFLLLQPGVNASVDQLQLLQSDKQLFADALKLTNQGQLSQAELIYRDLLERNNEWPEPKNNLAILLLKTDRLDEAKQILEQAVISEPSYRIAHNNRTLLYNYLAAQAYDKALGANQKLKFPEMQQIQEIHLPLMVVEKVVEKIIEKEVEVIVEKLVPAKIETSADEATDTLSASVGVNDAAAKNDLNDVKNHIRQQLLGWSRAWSQGDFEHYIQSYSTDFVPSDTRKNFNEWKNIRRGRLKYSKGISVNFDHLRVFLEADEKHALVELVQHYKSASYSDKVLKQMYMQNNQGNWLILSERTIKTY